MLELFSLIQSDLQNKKNIFIKDGAKISSFRVFISDGTSANIIHRLAFFCAQYKVLLPLALLFQHFNRIYNGCTIGVKADFNSGFVLMHPNGVVINSKVKIGNNVTIESGVVIGAEKGESPRLGNNIFIGTGAKIIGNVTIGDNVKIGANAVVVTNMPNDCTALGIPAKAKANKA